MRDERGAPARGGGWLDALRAKRPGPEAVPPALALAVLAAVTACLLGAAFGPDHWIGTYLNDRPAWVLLVVALLLLAATQTAWALCWLFPPKAIERENVRKGKTLLALVSCAPFVLWLAVIFVAGARPDVLGPGRHFFVEAAFIRPFAPIGGPLYCTGAYLAVARQRSARSSTSPSELLLTCGALVVLVVLAAVAAG